MDSPELAAAKMDGAFLRQILGISKDDNHATCKLCGKDNLRCKMKDGGYRWDCYSGCGGGSCVDALMLFEKKTLKEAMSIIYKTYGSGDSNNRQVRIIQQATRPEPVREFHSGSKQPEPVLDLERAEEFVKSSHGYLMDNLDLVTHFKRGISTPIIEKYRLGFIENVSIKWRPDDKGKGWNIPAAWVLPVTDFVGKLKAVKLHFEIRPISKGDPVKGEAKFIPCRGKSRWAPFGTEPKWDQARNVNPVHSYFGLWPHPDTLEDPALGEEFSSDIGWWINRIPDGPLRDEWYRAHEWEQHAVAEELSKTKDDLEPSEMNLAIERAFALLRERIFKAVGNKPIDADILDPDAPEPVRWKDFIFITPGELKAFAILSSGLRATAITSGESWIPPPDVLACFKGLNICILYDDDPPGLTLHGKTLWTGKAWAKQLAIALSRAGARSVAILSGGRKDNGQHPEEELVEVPL